MKNLSPTLLTPWQILQIAYEPVLKNIDTHFQKMAVTYMPIKGAFLILSGLGSIISSRKMKDIDILVQEKDFQKVVEYFNALEETEKVSSYWEFEQPFIYYFDNRKIYIEIHCLVNAPARFLLSTQNLFRRGIFHNSCCIFPHPVDSMLIHVCHHLLHIYKRFDVSFFSEIKVLEQQIGFSWELFWEQAQKTGIKPFIWLMIKMYSKIEGKTIIIPNWSNWYAVILNKFSLNQFSRMNPFYRKLLLEIPFVRSPLWLVKYKVLKTLKIKYIQH